MLASWPSETEDVLPDELALPVPLEPDLPLLLFETPLLEVASLLLAEAPDEEVLSLPLPVGELPARPFALPPQASQNAV
jgi:hypothetical protein